METQPDLEFKIRKILADNARLNVNVSILSCEADLYKAGMTSLAAVSVMLALEDQFEIEFSGEFLKRSTFSNIDSIEKAVTKSIG
jgi:acyl carrier protein